MVDRNRGNVVSFRSSRSSNEGQKAVVRKPLPRHVRRRRWIWLIAMLAFFFWSGSELIGQSMEVHERKTALAQSREEVQALQAEQRGLQEDVRRLQNEEYLLELARKLGYALPGEEVVDLDLHGN
ncbi:FtsB family cell division protein [Desmospora activa]|uniref:Septum formation initiator n=1 Tax=Desmospora activa DSM 45169 TaxID=1121389 RepID=A0A2T4Z1Z7_9BACL|nr:septum formation initiator family protein [Desmospora activa]PTM54807.1 septum formation initiator [Desmospora activa DSM 45169]